MKLFKTSIAIFGVTMLVAACHKSATNETTTTENTVTTENAATENTAAENVATDNNEVAPSNAVGNHTKDDTGIRH
jgi:ABC-type glycerol-3-phosphate transport system substrate-binding protein